MRIYNKLKVITVVGTRPEIIRLSRIINYFDESFEHILVHTGQNYDIELNEIFFKELNIKKPKYILSCAGKDSIETISNILLKTHRIFQNEKPDALVVLGDTNSSLSVISAKKLKIPIFHIEAGNRCFDQTNFRCLTKDETFDCEVQGPNHHTSIRISVSLVGYIVVC